MTKYYCKKCETELTTTGMTHRHGSKNLHCENCHLDHMYVEDPNGTSFLDTRKQHTKEDCPFCSNNNRQETAD